MRLAFDLKALKKDAEAEAEFRKLPWAEFPGRELKKPRIDDHLPLIRRGAARPRTRADP